MQQLIYAILTMVAGVIGCAVYFIGSNFILDMIFPARGSDTARAARNMRRASQIRPWLFLGPALIALTLYLVYPAFDSIRLSFMDRSGTQFVGMANYRWMIGDGQFRESIFNNFLWLLVVPAACTAFR